MLIPPSAALVLAAALTATDAVPPEGGRQTFTVGPGETRRHVIALEPGQFVQATVHQLDIDVVLRLVGPDGAVVEEEYDQSEGPVGLEPASLLATARGRYVVEVHAPLDVGVPGRYALESQAPRMADERDRTRREAERLTQIGGRYMGPRAAGIRRNRPGPEGRIAVPAYRAALPLWQQLGETCWEAEVGTCFALLQSWGSDPQSVDAFGRSLEAWQACGDDGRKYIEAVLFTGRTMVRFSRLREAAEILEAGLLLAREQSEVLTTYFLVALSGVHAQLGDTTRAIETGEEGLARVRTWHQQGTAVVLTNLANAHLRRGELQKANDRGLEALALRRAIQEELGIITGLTLMADIAQGLGEPELALSYLDEASAIGGQFGPNGAYAPVLGAASALRAMRRPAEARARLERGLELSESAAEPSVGLRARLTLATLLLEEGAAVEARRHVDRVLQEEGAIGDPLLKAEALQLLGEIHLAARDHAAAEAAADQALALRRSVGDRVGEVAALFLRAQAAHASADLDEARRRLESARAAIAEQRADLVSPRLRATWTGTVREVEEAYVSVLMALHAREPGGGFDARAFEASEAASARSLLELLGDADDPAPGTALERERSARERLTGALDRQMRALAARAPAAEREAIDKEVRDFSAEHERLRSSLRAGDSARRERPASLRLADVQSLLEDESTLLEFFLGPERGWAWVVGRGRLDSYELPPRARVDAAVSAVKRALAQPPAPGRPDQASRALRALASLVLPADRSLLRGTRLVVVADGSLHYVPFAALPDRAGQPLVTRFEVVHVPSASVAGQIRTELAGRQAAPNAIAVIADPVYDAGDERVAAPSRRASADPVLTRATRDFGFDGGRLPRLPFTRAEALSLRALAPASSRTLLDFSANVDAALSADLGSYRYLHFATHGLLNDSRPELSGLVLSLVDGKGRPRRGLLTAPDVSNLRLGAELVVLSSCRSAAGREVKGEGLLGLTRAFMHAGAPRVVASLWPVDDVASSRLMTRMYGRMLGPRKLAPAAALREAQLDLQRDPRWRAPYYWAAFQIQGEWR